MGRDIKRAGRIVVGDRIWIDNEDFTGWDTVTEIKHLSLGEFRAITRSSHRRYMADEIVEVQ